MNILHISAECYPIAKVGGLADVVGALPKYQKKHNVTSNVVMPYYNNTFTQNNSFETVHEDQLILGYDTVNFKILRLTNSNLEFDLYCVDIPELIYKEYVYSADDTERFLAFQIATLDWISSWQENPDIIHIHDHHTGLIPFMMTQSYKYKSLRFIPTILTIHNAQFHPFDYQK